MSEAFFWQRIFKSPFLTVILLTVVVFLGHSLYKNIKIKQELVSALDKIRQDIAELSKKNTELEKYLKFSSNKDFQEKEIKEILNLKRPGENVYSIINKEGLQLEAFSAKNIYEITKSNPQKWLEYFFKR